MQNALRLAGRAAGVKNEERLFTVERLGGVLGGNFADLVVPPSVAPRLHLDGVLRSLQDDDALDVAVTVFERGVDVGLERHDLPAPPAAVCRDDELRAAVRQPVLDRLGAEPAEDHRMHRADPRACQHGHRRFRDERHVNDHPVARRDASIDQHVGESANLGVQLGVGQRALIPRLAFPDDGGLVSTGVEMSIQTVFRDVEPSTHEPLGERRVPFEHDAPRYAPLQLGGLLGPEGVRVLDGKFVKLIVILAGADPCPLRKFRRGREHAGFVEVGLDVLAGGRLAHGEKKAMGFKRNVPKCRARPSLSSRK